MLPEPSHAPRRKPRSKSDAKNIRNPRDLALTLAKKHKQGEVVLGQRALLTVATVLDKTATDGQMRVMVKEAERLGIKLGFTPRCMKSSRKRP